MAYGRSQARSYFRAVAAGLPHSHSHAGSELCLQLTATLDPEPSEGGQGSNPRPPAYSSGLLAPSHDGSSSPRFSSPSPTPHVVLTYFEYRLLRLLLPPGCSCSGFVCWLAGTQTRAWRRTRAPDLSGGAEKGCCWVVRIPEDPLCRPGRPRRLVERVRSIKTSYL